ncbi:MAG: hypothetical protein C4519_19290 [Desulfobacteraceae bacterium]|nr:MAG: hypothetical protein C4519_19290 [Desulfobacteraceae bacterium]
MRPCLHLEKWRPQTGAQLLAPPWQAGAMPSRYLWPLVGNGRKVEKGGVRQTHFFTILFFRGGVFYRKVISSAAPARLENFPAGRDRGRVSNIHQPFFS